MDNTMENMGPDRPSTADAPLTSQLQSLTLNPANPTQSTRIAPILLLPFEISNRVLVHLAWPDFITLRLTHRHFSHVLLPRPALRAIHNTQQDHTHNAEVYYMAIVLGVTNPNWSGFKQGWALSAWSYASILPCYVCLRWLPSADPKLVTSAFTRGMGTGKRDLGQVAHRSRVCVLCGMRIGLYVRGNKVRYQVVCYGCGRLGDRVRREQHGDAKRDVERGLLKGVELRWHYFCRECVEIGNVPASRVEFEHGRRWGKYERGIAAGKKYRTEKGRKLRKEKGIEEPKSHGDGGGKGKGKEKALDDVYRPRHECPIMKEKSICQCWKHGDSETQPGWIMKVVKSPWKW